jgi:CBS domain-containing protein
MQVRDVMTPDPLSIGPNELLGAAYVLMRANNVRRLPVLNDGRRLIGIVALSDIRAARPSEQTVRNLWETHIRLLELKVVDVMNNNPLTVGPDDDIDRAAFLMLRNRVGGLPVCDGGYVLGIITESDIFDALTSQVAHPGWNRARRARVETAMTPDPVSIAPDATLKAAVAIMREKIVRRLPVVNELGNVVGIITLADALEAYPREEPRSLWDLHFRLWDLPVSEVMTPNPVTVSTDASLGDVAERMRDHKIGGIPVVDDGKLVGIITESDVFRALVEATEMAQVAS